MNSHIRGKYDVDFTYRCRNKRLPNNYAPMLMLDVVEIVCFLRLHSLLATASTYFRHDLASLWCLDNAGRYIDCDQPHSGRFS